MGNYTLGVPRETQGKYTLLGVQAAFREIQGKYTRGVQAAPKEIQGKYTLGAQAAPREIQWKYTLGAQAASRKIHGIPRCSMLSLAIPWNSLLLLRIHYYSFVCLDIPL